jgi:phage terminase large subunit
MSNKITLPHNWSPRNYQLPVWKYLEAGGKRAVSVWHRRAGKDLTAIHYCATATQKRVGLYLHVLPFYKQGRKIVWNGMDRLGKKFLDAFPEELIESRNEQDMMLRLKNGSIYQVIGSDNVDSLVGINPVGIILSEYSIQDPHVYDYLRPILAENGGWAWFIYTPRGRNHGYDLVVNARKTKTWFVEVLGVQDTNAIDTSVIEEDRIMGMDEATIQQEYYCSFDAPLKGAYYSQQMQDALEQGRITNIPWEPTLPVHTVWDLGFNDTNCIIFFQLVGKEVRVIDYYENSGEGMLHYFKELHKLPYVYGDHWAPHDIKVHEYSTGTSRLVTARKHGVKFREIPKTSVEDRIEAARNTLPKCYFNYDPESNDNQRLKWLMESLRQYQKEFDELKKVYKERPKKDWTNHAADTFGYMAQIIKTETKVHERPRKAKETFSEL